jgi:hypothetical protein
MVGTVSAVRLGWSVIPAGEHGPALAVGKSLDKGTCVVALVCFPDGDALDPDAFEVQAFGRRLDGFELEVDRDASVGSLVDAVAHVHATLAPLWSSDRYPS